MLDHVTSHAVTCFRFFFAALPYAFFRFFRLFRCRHAFDFTPSDATATPYVMRRYFYAFAADVRFFTHDYAP